MPTKKPSKGSAKSAKAQPSLKALLVAGASGRASKQVRAAKTSHLASASSRGKAQQARRDKRG